MLVNSSLYVGGGGGMCVNFVVALDQDRRK
jgi:hypothetical protein